MAEFYGQGRYGVIAVGAYHAFRPEDQTDGTLRFDDQTFGYVRYSGNDVTMKVQGNPDEYKHPIVYTRSLNYDRFYVTANQQAGYVVLMEIHDRFDLNASVYTRFSLIKVPYEYATLSDVYTTWSSPIKVSKPIVVVGDKVNSTKSSKKTFVANQVVTQVDEFSFGNDTVIRSGKETLFMINVAGQLRATSSYDIDPEGIRNRVKALKFGSIDYDFQMDAKTYNAVVAQIAKARRIDRKSILDVILATSVKTASVDICKYIVPIVASAMKEAAQLEVRISELIESNLGKFLTNCKEHEGPEKKSIFYRAAEYLFGSSRAPTGNDSWDF